MCQRFASPTLRPVLYLNNLGHRPQRLIYAMAIREKLRHIGIKHDYVRALGIPMCVFAANPAGKIVAIAHFVLFTSSLLQYFLRSRRCPPYANNTDRFRFFSVYHN